MADDGANQMATERSETPDQAAKSGKVKVSYWKTFQYDNDYSPKIIL